MRLIGAALIVLLFVVLVIITAGQHRTQTFPLIQAACPKLSNPCDKIDCNKPDTRSIA